MNPERHERHLSARAVEWLRASAWRFGRYAAPGGFPACWGLFHPGRGFSVPEWAMHVVEGFQRDLRRFMLEQAKPEHLKAWACVGREPMEPGIYFPPELRRLLDLETFTEVADVRAIMRGLTSSGSSKVWGRDGDENRDPRLPTCSTCAVLADEELSASKQRWEEPVEWRRERQAAALNDTGMMIDNDGAFVFGPLENFTTKRGKR